MTSGKIIQVISRCVGGRECVFLLIQFDNQLILSCTPSLHKKILPTWKKKSVLNAKHNYTSTIYSYVQHVTLCIQLYTPHTLYIELCVSHTLYVVMYISLCTTRYIMYMKQTVSTIYPSTAMYITHLLYVCYITSLYSTSYTSIYSYVHHTLHIILYIITLYTTRYTTYTKQKVSSTYPLSAETPSVRQSLLPTTSGVGLNTCLMSLTVRQSCKLVTQEVYSWMCITGLLADNFSS